jgi:hypothetical protein
LLFAPGGIFLAPLFLLATKNFGRNPDEVNTEQKEAEAAELELGKALEFLNAFKKYLPDPKEAKPNEVDKQEVSLEEDSNNSSTRTSKAKEVAEITTVVGIKAEKFNEEQAKSLQRTNETLGANQEALKRVKKTPVDTVNEATREDLEGVIKALKGITTNMEESGNATGPGMDLAPPQVPASNSVGK